jgi:hypothetical protein
MPEVRGGSFVEKQYGVGVTSQHRGWHALGDVVLHGGHGPCLVRTRCEEEDRLRLEDGSHAGRDRTLRSSSPLTLRVFTRRLMVTIRSGLFRCRQMRADVGFDRGTQGSVEASGTSTHPCLESLSGSNSSAAPAQMSTAPQSRLKRRCSRGADSRRPKGPNRADNGSNRLLLHIEVWTARLPLSDRGC